MAFKVLVACCGFGGPKASHLLRPWHMANHLFRAGFQVEFGGAGGDLHSLVGSVYPVHHLTDLDEAFLAQSLRTSGHAVYSYSELERMVAEDVRLIETSKPDVILADYRRSLSISARMTQVPLIAITNASWTEYSLLTTWSTTVTSASHLVEPFNRIRLTEGLPLIRSIDEALEGDITLLADVEEFSPTRALPDSHYYIGPIFWEDSLDVGRVVMGEVIHQSRPLIVADLGPWRVSEFSSLVRPQLQTSGCTCIEIKHDRKVLDTEAVNLLAENYFEVPMSHVGIAVQSADVLVTTGNLEAIYRAIRYRVPVLAIHAAVLRSFTSETS